jgi:hypothetical protein
MATDTPQTPAPGAPETAYPVNDDGPHASSPAGRLNWLRAGVLGANDGIVSVAGIVVGVAGATSARGPIFTAGLAGLVAGAVSMALGEYVSVSSQRDSEHALMAKEKRELREAPEEELEELAALYRAKGLSSATAHQVAVELSEHDALGAHLDAELNIDPTDLANPRAAAAASAVSFTRRAAAVDRRPAATGDATGSCLRGRRPGGSRGHRYRQRPTRRGRPTPGGDPRPRRRGSRAGPHVWHRTPLRHGPRLTERPTTGRIR